MHTATSYHHKPPAICQVGVTDLAMHAVLVCTKTRLCHIVQGCNGDEFPSLTPCECEWLVWHLRLAGCNSPCAQPLSNCEPMTVRKGHKTELCFSACAPCVQSPPSQAQPPHHFSTDQARVHGRHADGTSSFAAWPQHVWLSTPRHPIPAICPALPSPAAAWHALLLHDWLAALVSRPCQVVLTYAQARGLLLCSSSPAACPPAVQRRLCNELELRVWAQTNGSWSGAVCCSPCSLCVPVSFPLCQQHCTDKQPALSMLHLCPCFWGTCHASPAPSPCGGMRQACGLCLLLVLSTCLGTLRTQARPHVLVASQSAAPLRVRSVIVEHPCALPACGCLACSNFYCFVGQVSVLGSVGVQHAHARLFLGELGQSGKS